MVKKLILFILKQFLSYKMEVQNVEFSLNTENGDEKLKGVKITGSKRFQRQPTHTIVLLDVSGSMSDDSKLDVVKKSLHFLLNFFQNNDLFSLITFSENSDTIIEKKLATSENLQMFNFTIGKITTEGGTNLSAGLLNVKTLLDSFDPPTRLMKTGLIVLTDGYTNLGVTKEESLLNIMWSLRNVQPNLSINSIGYGDLHNANLLKSLAVNGNGSYNIVRNIEEVGTVFGDVLGGLISCVLQNLLIRYPTSWNCLNEYPTNSKIDTNLMNVGDVYAESETIILFENSDTKSVQIQAIDTSTYNSINKEISWGFNSQSIELQPFIIAYVRLKVSNCLNLIKNKNNHTSIKNKLNYLSVILENPIVHSNPLFQMLKDEISSIQEQIDNPYGNSSTGSSQNVQHSAFLSLSRGISASRTRAETNSTSYDEVIDRVVSMNIQTPFANRTQRMISQSITAYSQDPSNSV